MRLRFGGRTFDEPGDGSAPRVEALGESAYLWRDGDKTKVFHCVRDGDDVSLFWGGVAYRGSVEREGSRGHAHHAASGAIESPMPGKVIAVKVAEGDAVRKGDELVVVEAMKMENALRAPHDGRVSRLVARVGETVGAGAVLVVIE